MDSIMMSCVKYLLFSFNLLCSLSGVVLVLLGVYTLNSFDKFSAFFDESTLKLIPWTFVGIGAAIFIIAFFGCCGSLRESNCMLIMFSLLLFVMVVLEVLLAGAFFVIQANYKPMIQTKLNNSMSNYHKDINIQKTWDWLQLDFKCCGVESYKDWTSVFPEDDSLPSSCCQIVNKDSGCQNSEAFKSGCFKMIFSKFNESIPGFLIVAGIVLLIELIECLFACLLASSIRHEYETV